jgi:hypothetical protein
MMLFLRPLLRPTRRVFFSTFNNVKNSRREHQLKAHENIYDYALSNGFVKDAKGMKGKSEAQIAIQIMQEINESEKNLQLFKIFPLYNIGSKSRELQKDRLFWLMLTGMTVQFKMT